MKQNNKFENMFSGIHQNVQTKAISWATFIPALFSVSLLTVGNDLIVSYVYQYIKTFALKSVNWRWLRSCRNLSTNHWLPFNKSVLIRLLTRKYGSNIYEILTILLMESLIDHSCANLRNINLEIITNYYTM